MPFVMDERTEEGLGPSLTRLGRLASLIELRARCRSQVDDGPQRDLVEHIPAHEGQLMAELYVDVAKDAQTEQRADDEGEDPPTAMEGHDTAYDAGHRRRHDHEGQDHQDVGRRWRLSATGHGACHHAEQIEDAEARQETGDVSLLEDGQRSPQKAKATSKDVHKDPSFDLDDLRDPPRLA